jgi:hypothetical protein
VSVKRSRTSSLTCETLFLAAMAVYMNRNIFWKALLHVSHSVSVTLSLLTSLIASSVHFWEASKALRRCLTILE